jgi:hypothetical protein
MKSSERKLMVNQRYMPNLALKMRLEIVKNELERSQPSSKMKDRSDYM